MRQKIFKKQEMKKKDFYAWFKRTLTEVGWENISSKPSTDFDVFYSKGESGSDELYFQIKEYYDSSTTNTLSGSNERFFDIRLLKKYTPGEPGTAGIFDRKNDIMYRLQIAAGTITPETDMTVYYNVNKNRIIFMTEFPIGIKENSVLNMIGKPDEHIAKYYPDGSMMYFATTALNGIAFALDEADSTRKAMFGIATHEMITPRVKNSSGMFFMSEFSVKLSSEIKALIDGVYVLADDFTFNTNANRGDILIDKDGNKYQIFYLTTRSSTAYYYYDVTRYMALRIE
ncbi:virion structural protein [Bacillus phage G]|uniref:Gp373 n=1 Tax=Bacillus phage G TaxID=2884420 RepID=G3MAB4_9CAUD|nr:virion structural protein [Bacillus phage G]AEO93632.1 gp373 [Bacillus phage G]